MFALSQAEAYFLGQILFGGGGGIEPDNNLIPTLDPEEVQALNRKRMKFQYFMRSLYDTFWLGANDIL